MHPAWQAQGSNRSVQSGLSVQPGKHEALTTPSRAPTPYTGSPRSHQAWQTRRARSLQPGSSRQATAAYHTGGDLLSRTSRLAFLRSLYPGPIGKPRGRTHHSQPTTGVSALPVSGLAHMQPQHHPTVHRQPTPCVSALPVSGLAHMQTRPQLAGHR